MKCVIVTVKEKYIRNTEVFCNKEMSEEELHDAEESGDIYYGAEYERYWEERQLSGFLGFVSGESSAEVEQKVAELLDEKRIPKNIVKIEEVGGFER